jgi:hypothetical protein
MSQDWDNLLILDACRYDMFRRLNPLGGDLRPVVSKGSTTVEFLRKNFEADQYADAVYVSANPHVQNHGVDEKFFDRLRLWETHWDEDLSTVPPDAVVDASVDIHERHPHKRLIIHFIQPHYPFIGETGCAIEHGTVTGDGLIYDEREVADVWTKLERGAVTRERVWEAYLENLELLFPHVETLTERLDGKTVVTSDHGNALGEWGLYGHPGGRYLSALVKVPWLVIDGGPRRRIEAGTTRATTVDTNVDERLGERFENLGYT